MKKRTTKTQTHKSPLFGAIIGALLAIYSIGIILLIFWGVSTSLKPENNILQFLGFEFKNYAKAIEAIAVDFKSGDGRADIFVLFHNSILYSCGCAFIRTFTTCTVAYLCARYNNKFSKFIYYLVIVTIALPIVGNTASLLNISRDLGIFNTLWGQIIMKLGFNNIYFLIFYSAFKKIPNAYSEAANVDGAGHFLVYFRVIFPLVKTLFITIFLLNTILFWNDYQGPMLFLPSHPTLAVAIWENFVNSSKMAGNFPIQCASGVIVFIPIFIIFLIFKNKIMGNFEGGIKE